MPSPVVVLTTWVGHAVPSSTATRCTGPIPGSGTVTRPARARAAAFTTMVDDGGASTVVARWRSASRVRASPTCRASWYRTRTASTTSSWLHAHDESWALLST